MQNRDQTRIRFGKALREVRTAAGKSRVDVGHGSGLHPTSIALIETGKRDPSWDTVVRMARGIGASLADIAAAYERQPVPPPPKRPSRKPPSRKPPSRKPPSRKPPSRKPPSH